MSLSIYSLPGQTRAVQSRGEKWAQWIWTHRNQLGLAVGVAVIAGGLAAAIVVNRKKLEEAGVLQLSAARFQMSQGKGKEAVQSINEVLQAQRTSPIAMQGYVLKGEFLMEERKFEDAAKTYEEGYRQASWPTYKALMLAGEALAQGEMQKFDVAAERYEKLIHDFPDHYLVPRSYMELGRLRAAQQRWKESQSVFERVLVLYPKSPWAAEAQSNLAFVKTKLPAAPVEVETAKK